MLDGMIVQLPITTLLAAYLASLLVWLALRTIALRRANKVSIGTGDISTLARASRGHANLAEYGPFAILLCGLAEWQGAQRWWLVPTVLAFAAGRAMHAYSFTRSKQEFTWRMAGMHMTLWPLMGLIVIALGSLVR